MSARARYCLLALFAIAPGPILTHAQQQANSNASYRQLRNLLPGGEVLAVKDMELKRDAATFSFREGSFALYGEVNGKVTGAVFRGEGHLHITPPTTQERHSLSLAMKTEEFDEDFSEAVLRFTDGTAAELRKAAAGKGTIDPSFGKTAMEMQDFARHKLHRNFDLRIAQDVLSTAPGGAFIAAVHGRKNPHLYFFLDPNGVGELAPEEVALLNWNWQDNTPTFPLSFHRAAEYASGTASSKENNSAFTVTHEDLDVSIEKSGFLSSLATVEVRAEQDGVAVLPFDLFKTLRVSRVQSGKGDNLDWVQEDKENDPDFGVILASPLRKGETATVKITYGGKDVVQNMGNGNYYPVAREDWYPSRGFGSYATYTMKFHVPRELEIVATGNKTGSATDGKITTTEWKTDIPLAVVGFSLGDFETKETKIGSATSGQLTLDVYANKGKPDSLLQVEGEALGALETTRLLANELGQGEAAVRIYSSYFGALPFTHIDLTQQSACDYGQSWPMLVYLPICAFFDATQQHFLGIGGEDLSNSMYWKVVTPHEVAHQWWGQTVGFGSYRDQWMSEGFAAASASIFLQASRPKPDDFINFWQEERRQLTEKNKEGFRPIDVGPVTMGVRLSSPKAGWNIYSDLVYPKGAYILHMIRMMMWTAKEGDARFKATMQDFASTYRLKTATTEDFKAIIEKHMSQGMDLEGNHRMDWFFREYVYGTDLPAYHFESDVTPNGNGWILHFKLTQSGVDANFANSVPIYLELANGGVVRLGSAVIYGSTSEEKTVPLPKFPSPVKRAVINHFNDILCTNN